MVIVIGYIPTPEGEAALQRGLDEARQHGARVVVVNSSRGDSSIDERLALGDRRDHLDETLTAAGVDFEVRQPVRGRNAAEEVLEIAEAVAADLVVIGVRRRSAVGKLFMGSTAQTILLDAACPVLAVKASSSASGAQAGR
jgi:nucleotide-binding universal stress UspA family protein